MKFNEALANERGIPWIWVSGGAVVTILALLVSFVGFILSQGLPPFWPKDVLSVQDQQEQYLGIPVRTATSLGEEGKKNVVLLYKANRDQNPQEFIFVSEDSVKQAQKEKDVWYMERKEWGPWIGYLDSSDVQNMEQQLEAAKKRAKEIHQIQRYTLGNLNETLETERLKIRELAKSNHVKNAAEIEKINLHIEDIQKKYDSISQDVQKQIAADAMFTVKGKTSDGHAFTTPWSNVVRAYQPNQLNFMSKMKVYASRVWEFVSEEPREANLEGGVFPALFGTFMMTLLMSLAVLPLGVITAVYMNEIAKKGPVMNFLRISVSNLAGVPSIVFGVFGLGFFCYGIGGWIDQSFFSERLPTPTFGTGGILWASLTLALLTLPVVIVSTEEALAAVPRTLRDASYGCGATRLQTILRVVLPHATPGIMTGLILAMARGAGEVAPLLLTGVVKLAPEMPLDTHFPFLHLERSFMHLGFHIYDVGFQSRSAELGKPMVFVSTVLLIGLVFILNIFAVRLRSKLRKRVEGRGAF